MWTASGFIAAFHGLDSFPVPRMYLVFTLLESFRLSHVVWERYLCGALVIWRLVVWVPVQVSDHCRSILVWTAQGFHSLDSFPVPRMYHGFILLESLALLSTPALSNLNFKLATRWQFSSKLYHHFCLTILIVWKLQHCPASTLQNFRIFFQINCSHVACNFKSVPNAKGRQRQFSPWKDH